MRLIGSLTTLILPLIALLTFSHSAHATVFGIESRGSCPLDYPVEFYLIEEETGSFERVTAPIDPVWRFCSVFGVTKRRRDGAFYAIGHEWNDEERRNRPVLIKISPNTWNITTVGQLTVSPGDDRPHDRALSALASSPTDELYAVYILPEPASSVLVRLDPDTGAEEARVTLTGIVPTGLEFGSDGTLYGWNPLAGLVTIDPATGTTTDVKPGNEDDPHRVSAIAFAPDGTLYGFPGYLHATANEGWIFRIDHRSGDANRAVYMGPGWWPFVDGVAHLGSHPSLVERPPRRFMTDNIFLLDCLPCPQCFGRMCDPRVNPGFDQFFLIEPKSGIAEILKRSEIGLHSGDGPLKAGGSIKIQDKTVLVIAAPLAGKSQAGAVLFLNTKGKLISRVDGKPGDTLGLAMDVRGSDVAVASAKHLVRFRGTKVVSRLVFDSALRVQKALRIAFVDDTDGDKRPEILIGAPYATANGLTEAGTILKIGSKTGQIIRTEIGSTAGQHLGFSLQR